MSNAILTSAVQSNFGKAEGLPEILVQKLGVETVEAVAALAQNAALKVADTDDAITEINTQFRLLISTLPRTTAEDGSTRLNRDSNECKALVTWLKTKILDRLMHAPNYSGHYAKLPGPTGVLAWVQYQPHAKKAGIGFVTQIERKGKVRTEIELGDAKTFYLDGVMADPRQRFKCDDDLLASQVRNPVKKRMEGCANTTVSRLLSEPKTGGTKSDAADAAKKHFDWYVGFCDKRRKDGFPVATSEEITRVVRSLWTMAGFTG